MKTTHGSFTRSAGAPIHHHRGSCQGNIRRKYSFSSFFLLFTWAVASEILEENILFFRHLSSHVKNIRKKGYFLFHIFTPFFLILICGHEILLNLFLSQNPFFSPYVYGWTGNFFPSLHKVSERYYENFCNIITFFSSYVSGWTEKLFP